MAQMAALSLEEQLRARGLELLGACEGLSQRPDLLKQCALLSDFTVTEADLLGVSMLRVRAQPGQLLIAEDEASDWMMVLLRGTVDVGKRLLVTHDFHPSSSSYLYEVITVPSPSPT
jgi:hypothetical protein